MMDQALSRAIAKKKSLYFKYQATKSTTDYYNYASQRNLVKAKVRSAQMTYEEKLVKKCKNNHKHFAATSSLSRRLRILL